jgi:hypothetical protein
MIQPEDLRRKAENLYPLCIQAWLDRDEEFFPRVVPAGKALDADNLSAAVQSVRRLREESKEVVGYGYSIEWREVNSRKFGKNKFPVRILFETQDDLLRFAGRQREFRIFTDAVTRLREAFPTLEKWIRGNVRTLIEAASDLDGLICVLQFFRDNPRANRFARELPIPVDTKFIERYQGLLQDWLDIVLPPHTIRADEKHFERRYGLRYAEPHLLVRLLDPSLEKELCCPCSELSLPLHTLGAMAIRANAAIIVENKVNLLTLPFLPRTIGLGGLGSNVVLMRYLPWLNSVPVVYWGDIDIEGFEILSSLRAIFPSARSFLMDSATLERWPSLVVPGTGRHRDVPAHLTDSEQQTFLRCRDENLRLEQERIPQDVMLKEISQRLSAG